MYTHIVIHHSLTKDSETVSWNAIRRYHMDIKGWRDIGYNFGIELIKDHYEILFGRMLGERGAHCIQEEMNRFGIGICMIGNFDTRRPDGGQWSLAQKLCKAMMKLYSIPVENVKGHTELYPAKTCPGRMFDMHQFRDDLKA